MWNVSWFGWKGPFLRPGLTTPRRRAQPRSRMAEGHRACAARSVLDGGEHVARLDQDGPTERMRTSEHERYDPDAAGARPAAAMDRGGRPVRRRSASAGYRD